ARRGGAGRARELARELWSRYGCAAVVKGGHGEGDAAVDVLCEGGEISEFSAPRVAEPVSTHGTGCSFAAALAAELATGRCLADAVAGAKRYVLAAIRRAYFAGNNCGVLGFVEPADLI
ncbi:MAG: bifunctional hydroxymethylpyrimidine kinase/phosphomethylpyrimidine kinase, partial [Kiritimatiellae bacterium]|nr:bifunctional hydroxymethylpyrimidine kinase/phosphomethylpyrimidine kinase [Kiritimatiellia bacterium]